MALWNVGFQEVGSQPYNLLCNTTTTTLATCDVISKQTQPTVETLRWINSNVTGQEKDGNMRLPPWGQREKEEIRLRSGQQSPDLYLIPSCERLIFFQLARGQKLTCPAMNIHDAVTCTMFNNYYAPKESIIDAIKVGHID